MKKFSRLSMLFLLAGLTFVIAYWLMQDSLEAFFLTGLLSLFLGVIFSFLAIVRRENGKTKFASLISVFVIGLAITWFEPFEIVRMMTWLKNSN